MAILQFINHCLSPLDPFLPGYKATYSVFLYQCLWYIYYNLSLYPSDYHCCSGTLLDIRLVIVKTDNQSFDCSLELFMVMS